MVLEQQQSSVTFNNSIVGLLNTDLLSLPAYAPATASFCVCKQIYFPVSSELCSLVNQ